MGVLSAPHGGGTRGTPAGPGPAAGTAAAGRETRIVPRADGAGVSRPDSRSRSFPPTDGIAVTPSQSRPKVLLNVPKLWIEVARG